MRTDDRIRGPDGETVSGTDRRSGRAVQGLAAAGLYGLFSLAVFLCGTQTVPVAVLGAGGAAAVFFLCSLRRRESRAALAACLLLTPPAAYAVTECCGSRLISVSAGCAVLGVVLYFEFFFFLFFLTGRMHAGFLAGLGAAFLLGCVNHFLVAFRGEPLAPWDLPSVKTALNVAGRYRFGDADNTELLVSVLVLVCCAALLLRTAELRVRGPARGAWAAVCLAALLLTGRGVQTDLFQTAFQITDTDISQYYAMRVDGVLVNYLRELKWMHVPAPEGYDSFVFPDPGPVPDSAADWAPDAAAGGEKTNLIVIVDESFGDLRDQCSFRMSGELMPVCDALVQSENTWSGHVYMSTVSGGTACTESEFLTGVPERFLPPGSSPFSCWIDEKMPALPWLLQDLGYETFGYHPGDPASYRRQDVWPRLGIRNMRFREDFAFRDEVRDLVSDASCFRQIIADFEEHGPGFYYCVTIQNHGGFTALDHEDYSDNPLELTVQVESPRAGMTETADTWLSLVRESDRALGELVQWFSRREEPTVILFFGDHSQTMFDPAFYRACRGYGRDEADWSDEVLLGTYRTPFLLWANYDIPEVRDLDLSLYGLPCLLLRAAGLPESRYLRALEEHMGKTPVLTTRFGLDGEGWHFDRDGDWAGDSLDDFEQLAWHTMFDSENWNWDLYLAAGPEGGGS